MVHGSDRVRGGQDRSAGDMARRELVVLVFSLLAAVIVLGAADIYLINGQDSAPTTGPQLEVRVLEGAVKSNPIDYASRRQLAYAYQQAGRRGRALDEYSKVLAAYPDDLASLYNSGILLLGSWRNAEGEKDLLRVLQLAPTHALAAETLGEHYAKQQRFNRVLAVVLPAAAAHPDFADLQYLAGLGYEHNGEFVMAEKYYRHALELAPDMGEARQGLARTGGAK